MKITYKQKLSVVTLRTNGIDFSKDVYALSNSEITLIRDMANRYNYSPKDNGSSLSKTSRFYVFMQRIFNYMEKNKINTKTFG